MSEPVLRITCLSDMQDHRRHARSPDSESGRRDDVRYHRVSEPIFRNPHFRQVGPTDCEKERLREDGGCCENERIRR